MMEIDHHRFQGLLGRNYITFNRTSENWEMTTHTSIQVSISPLFYKKLSVDYARTLLLKYWMKYFTENVIEIEHHCYFHQNLRYSFLYFG